MPDFSRRSEQQEIMDDLQCSGAVVHQTLRELETINDLLGGNYVTLNGIAQLLRNKEVPPALKIADVGCGSGDMLKLIRRWSDKRGLDPELTGIDANPSIIAYAANHTPATCRIKYETLDIFSPSFKARQYDIVVGTLFFHHFSNETLTSFFRALSSQVRIGFIINDIHRHWFAYYSIRLLTRLFSQSPMVKFDAPLSVLRAFKKGELIDILKTAGIIDYEVRWMWAFRWQVVVHTR